MDTYVPIHKKRSLPALLCCGPTAEASSEAFVTALKEVRKEEGASRIASVDWRHGVSLLAEDDRSIEHKEKASLPIKKSVSFAPHLQEYKRKTTLSSLQSNDNDGEEEDVSSDDNSSDSDDDLEEALPAETKKKRRLQRLRSTAHHLRRVAGKVKHHAAKKTGNVASSCYRCSTLVGSLASSSIYLAAIFLLLIITLIIVDSIIDIKPVDLMLLFTGMGVVTLFFGCCLGIWNSRSGVYD